MKHLQGNNKDTCSECCRNTLHTQQCCSFVYFGWSVSCFLEHVVTSLALQSKVWPVKKTHQRGGDTFKV